MNHFLLTIVLLVSFTSFSQKKDCKSFHDGKFYIEDAETGKSIIERKGSEQIEYLENSDVRLYFKVKWLNDCTYELRLKKIVEAGESHKVKDKSVIKVEILETYEQAYLMLVTSTSSDISLKAVMNVMQ